jgi:hypothetical protein
MKTENEISNAILKTTMEIQKKFPELSKYLTEMPVTIPDAVNPEITIGNLEEYSESLNTLVTKYSKNHKENKNKEGSITD